MREPLRPVVLDANLLLLLVVGEADPRLIADHKRLRSKGYDVDDYVKLRYLLSAYAELVLMPNIVSEVSNIANFGLKGPAVRQVGESLGSIIRLYREAYLPSIAGVARPEYLDLGLTDSVLLALVETGVDGEHPTLITVDRKLIARGLAYGLDVIDYDQIR